MQVNPWTDTPVSIAQIGNKIVEETMVETSHIAGQWPGLYEPFRNIGRKVANWFAPSSEASALKDHYEIDIELPGVKAEDVHVSMNENTLTVRGEKHSRRKAEGRDYFFSELEYGAFQRSFRLPPDANGEEVDAEMSNGVLNLKIAKRTPAKTKGKKIPVRSE